MSKYYLHYIPFNAEVSSFDISLQEPYKVVLGVGFYANYMPVKCPHSHLVAGGVEGLPYTGDAGRGGVVVRPTFPNQVTGVLVATYSELKPVPTVSNVLVVNSQNIYPGGGSGTGVTKVTLTLGGTNYVVVSWANGQPLQAYQNAYKVGDAWTGVKPGYTLIEDAITKLV